MRDYKQQPPGSPIWSYLELEDEPAPEQVLQVTQDGQFIWCDDADVRIAAMDQTSMKSILARLRVADEMQAALQLVKERFVPSKPCHMQDWELAVHSALAKATGDSARGQP